MKDLEYQQKAINELTNKSIELLNLGGNSKKLVFEAPTGSGKTIMVCQALANIAEEMQNRGDSLYQEAAFIWFAPRKLHLQSYSKLKGIFASSHRLRPLMFDELEKSEGIQAGEILFVNWESLIKNDNLMVRDTENSDSIYEICRKTKEEHWLPIIAVIDEEHMFWSKTADKSANVLNEISPALEIRVSATPKTQNPDALVKIFREEVIKAGMIKKEVILNPDIELDFSEERSLNENLVRTALDKRNQIAKTYDDLGENINPLLLIQLPNDTKESMTKEDSAVAEQVKTYLQACHDITTENGKLAVWLSNEKSNLAGLENPDSLVQVLLFKEAIALGWDCPRAAVLLIFRKLQSDCFTIQTVGRILRMPMQKHYTKEILNVGYVYTDIAKDKIQIIAEDTSYLFKNTITAIRRENLNNVSLTTYYPERPNSERNYLGPDFRKTLYETAQEFWKLERGANLFSIRELADSKAAGNENHDETENNCSKMAMSDNSIKLDVQDINVEIPKDVHFQPTVQILEVNSVKFARTASEIDRVYVSYISTKGQMFESKGRTDKIANYLTELLGNFFSVYGTEAKKIVLYNDNVPKIDRLLDLAFARYAEKRRSDKTNRTMKEYQWEVPEERIYDAESNHSVVAEHHAMQPFVELNKASSPEKKFVEFLEQNSQYIDWWYKNGDKGKDNYAVPYGTGKSLFYVDFVIRMKNGHIYLFDTKSAGSDPNAPKKHNALLQYISEKSTEEMPLSGGIIINPENSANWLYCKTAIENTTDMKKWDCFYPDKA